MAGADAQLEGLGTERSSREYALAVALVVIGFIVAAAASPLRHGLRDFLWNISSYWGPQALLLMLLLPLRPRPAVVAGIALALTLHFVAFDAWIHTLPPREALAWLYYLFSFPGALIGAASAALVSRRLPRFSAVRVGAGTVALTAAGIALNHWATVLTK